MRTTILCPLLFLIILQPVNGYGIGDQQSYDVEKTYVPTIYENITMNYDGDYVDIPEESPIKPINLQGELKVEITNMSQLMDYKYPTYSLMFQEQESIENDYPLLTTYIDSDQFDFSCPYFITTFQPFLNEISSNFIVIDIESISEYCFQQNLAKFARDYDKDYNISSFKMLETNKYFEIVRRENLNLSMYPNMEKSKKEKVEAIEFEERIKFALVEKDNLRGFSLQVSTKIDEDKLREVMLDILEPHFRMYYEFENIYEVLYDMTTGWMQLSVKTNIQKSFITNHETKTLYKTINDLREKIQIPNLGFTDLSGFIITTSSVFLSSPNIGIIVMLVAINWKKKRRGDKID